VNKDYDEWNKMKKIVNKNRTRKLYHKRDIWWCNLGLNVGYEQDGTGKDYDRPALILKDFNQYVCLVIPLTSSSKISKYYIDIGCIGGKKSKAIISQIKLIDTKRLINKVEMLDKEVFNKIRKAVRNLI